MAKRRSHPGPPLPRLGVGAWDVFDEIDTLVVPPDLSAALAADPTAACYFGSLSASQRKMQPSWIASAKREETRTRRVSEVVRAAVEGRKLIR